MMHLVETFSVEQGGYKPVQNLSESAYTIRVREGKDDKVYKAKAVYTFPISRPGVKNLNGRIYPVALWENVIRKHEGEGSFGLMNHPEDDGSVKDIWCVWKNLRLSEDKSLLLCDAYLVGRNGQDVKEMLEAGGKIGLSTSGFGEFTADNVTLDADSYELERVADFVFNPSAQVYGEQSGLISENPKIEQEESVEVHEDVDDGEKKVMAEKTNNGGVSPTLMQKSVRLNLQSMWGEAKAEKDLVARMAKEENLLSEANEDFTKDIHDEISEALEKDRKAYADYAKKGMMSEASEPELAKKLSVLEEENKALHDSITKQSANFDLVTEKLNRAETLCDSLKLYSSKMKSSYKDIVAEKNAMIDPARYKEAVVYGDQCDKQIDELKNRIASLEEDVDNLKKERDNALAERDSLRRRVGAVKSESRTVERNSKRKADISNSRIAYLKKQIDALRRQLETVTVNAPEGEDVEVNMESEPENAPDIEVQAVPTASATVVPAEDADDEAEEAPVEEEPQKEAVDPDVRLYYRDLYRKNPAVSKIKEDILKCRNVLDAQRTYLRLHGIVDMENPVAYEEPKVQESAEPSIQEILNKSTEKVHKGWL